MQVLGVFSGDVLELVATTLAELGIKRAFVVHGAGGLDEISLAGETRIAEVRGGGVRLFSVMPEEFGVERAPLESIRGGTPQENAAMIKAIFDGESGARRDVVIVNAAAALVVTGVARDFREAAVLAARAIASGAAREKLQQLVAFTRQEKPRGAPSSS
jgi:anthranilate phosphoribosyltransferase